MAIFGTLEEMPLPEILTMLGGRTGKLLLSKLPREQTCDLYLDKSKLKALHLNGKSITREEVVSKVMLKVFTVEQGIFEFKRLSPDQLEQTLNMPIDKLLLQTATNIDEKQYNERFPDSQTRFKSAGHVDIWLDNALYNFWQDSSSLLSKGCSAQEIAEHLSLDVQIVQQNLYKLRSLGKIAPLRAFQQDAISSQIKSGTTPEVAPENLNKDIDKMDYKEIAAWLHSSTPKPQAYQKPNNQTKANSSSPARQRGLIDRLLKALSRHK